ncbi:hypothetical protein ACSHWI_16180, partial [Methylococcus sp. S2T]|uniref:hypothetical protein n=1 Tax=Methylococcus sp. S2T TaxID=3438967 RepID=UPI003EDA5443
HPAPLSSAMPCTAPSNTLKAASSGSVERGRVPLMGLGHLRRQRHGGSRLGAANRGHTAQRRSSRVPMPWSVNSKAV